MARASGGASLRDDRQGCARVDSHQATPATTRFSDAASRNVRWMPMPPISTTPVSSAPATAPAVFTA